jgi:hypothetical protein
MTPDAATQAEPSASAPSAASTVNVVPIAPNMDVSKGPQEQSAEPVEIDPKLIADARTLLTYAAEEGIVLESAMIERILLARRKDTEENSIAAMEAITKLTKMMKPVTAEMVRACDGGQRIVDWYGKRAIVLLVVLLALSFVSSAVKDLSAKIDAGIKRANEAVVFLNTDPQIVPHLMAGDNSAIDPKVGQSLQSVAAEMRDLYGLSNQLWLFVPWVDAMDFRGLRTCENGAVAGPDERAMEICLPARYGDITEKTKAYQRVRYYAQNASNWATSVYGAISLFALPTLYAILGAFAYLIRTFPLEMNSHIFMPAASRRARIIMAAIGGFAIGLFNNVGLGTESSLSPLALAFVVGYATDIFFSFLEGLQLFAKNRGTQPDKAAATNSIG